MVFEFDDFGCNHIISDMCQSHDCRDKLLELREINPAFKVTLFAIPYEMTRELLDWCEENKSWVELAVHGFYHSSNYECEKMDYDTFEVMINSVMFDYPQFKKVFRAPGWQISDDVLRWLAGNGWVIADQGYNDERRPHYAKAYVNYDGQFKVIRGDREPVSVEGVHGHVWDCMSNGIYEAFDHYAQLVSAADKFLFVSEVVDENH